MSLFENYSHSLDNNERQPALDNLLIRPAVVSDTRDLGAIEAERGGGDAAENALRLERSIASWAATSQGFILVAEHDGRLVGLAKVRYFNPPDDAPLNVAPSGWYLAGVIVVPECRHRSVGRYLTQARLDWIARRDRLAYYFANARNRVSIELHQQFGFIELTRDFTHPWTTFEGGVGILFRVELEQLQE